MQGEETMRKVFNLMWCCDKYGTYENVTVAAMKTRLCLSRGSLKECSSRKVFKLPNLH